MALEADIVSALTGSPGIGAPVYPIVRDEGTGLPAVTYSRVSNVPTTSLSGESNLDSVRLQFDCWATTYAAARTLAAAVRAAFQTSDFKAVLISDFDDYEPDTRTYRASLDMRFWDRL